MTSDSGATVHASAVLAGRCAILIRGLAGSGKSQLVLSILNAAKVGLVGFARLVADDRVELEACQGRLLARAPAALAGLIEMRGVGILHVDYEPIAVVGLVVDLDASDATRMPAAADTTTVVAGIVLPRLAIGRGENALLAVIERLRNEQP
jgi:serine kinase of HPr protein (carbohydrate metabolism regulator)